MRLEYAKNPQWADAAHTAIDVVTKWDGVPHELAFTATLSDVEAHGRVIFAEAVAGKFGQVAEYAPPATSAPLELIMDSPE